MAATLSPPRILPSGDSAITLQSSRHIADDGIDLEDVPKALDTTPDDIVARQIAGDYRVAMIGFTPGWSYLSGLEEFLHMPRRQNPRLLTPSGTISIGGVQTGIQCL